MNQISYVASIFAKTLVLISQAILEGLEKAGYETKGHEGELLNLFASFENKVQVAQPTSLYPEILSKTLELMIAARKPEKGDVAEEDVYKFGQRIQDWEPFPDSAAALQYLQKHYKLVILSNVDRDSFKFSEAKLGVTFDAVITAQDVGAYKPAFNHFNHALELINEKWGFKKHQVLHTFNSFFHDAFPANQLEISTAFIDRAPLAPGASAAPATPLPPKLNFQFPTLQGLADAHKKLTESQ